MPKKTIFQIYSKAKNKLVFSEKLELATKLNLWPVPVSKTPGVFM